MKLIKHYIEKIDEFVDKNYCADGCKECHEIGHNLVPKNDEETKKAILKLVNEIYNEGYNDGIDAAKEVLEKKK